MADDLQDLAGQDLAAPVDGDGGLVDDEGTDVIDRTAGSDEAAREPGDPDAHLLEGLGAGPDHLSPEEAALHVIDDGALG